MTTGTFQRFAALVLVCLCAGCAVSSSGGSASDNSESNHSPAYMLASLDGDASSGAVADMQQALDGLAPMCNEPENSLADYAEKSADLMMKDRGIDESRLSILQHVKDSIPSALGRTQCADMFAAYVTLREG